jgi:hypothetical protein
VGLYGGVYGSSDAPFIDFNSGSLFQATDLSGCNISGTLVASRVESVPEPGTFSILALGLAVIAFRRRLLLSHVKALHLGS